MNEFLNRYSIKAQKASGLSKESTLQDLVQDVEGIRKKVVDNQHKKISGYRDLTQDEIDVVNEIKYEQKRIAVLWKALIQEYPTINCDMRQMNIAKTHFEEGFMAFVKAITKPEDPFELSK